MRRFSFIFFLIFGVASYGAIPDNSTSAKPVVSSHEAAPKAQSAPTSKHETNPNAVPVQRLESDFAFDGSDGPLTQMKLNLSYSIHGNKVKGFMETSVIQPGGLKGAISGEPRTPFVGNVSKDGHMFIGLKNPKDGSMLLGLILNPKGEIEKMFYMKRPAFVSSKPLDNLKKYAGTFDVTINGKPKTAHFSLITDSPTTPTTGKYIQQNLVDTTFGAGGDSDGTRLLVRA